MAKKHGKNTRIYIDEFNISGDTNNVDVAATVDSAETSGMGTNSKTFLPGLADATISITGVFNDGTGKVDTVLADYRQGQETGLLSYCPDGVADADIVYSNDTAICQSVQHTSGIGGAVVLNHNWKCSGDLERMLIVYEGTITETTNGSGVDFGSVGTAGKGVAVIHVTAVSGSGTLDVKLQESDDDGDQDAYGDLSGAVFTQLAAIGDQRDTWDGAAEQYLRAVMTVAGFTSITLIVAAKIGGSTA